MDTGWWVGNYIQNGQISTLAAWVFWVIFSICLHELAHGWVAIWQGDDTPRETGHMTLNPLVHMGPWSLVVFALVGIAWGAMPVNPDRFRWRHMGEVLVSAAGPAMNLLLAAICLTTLGVIVGMSSGQPDPSQERLLTFFYLGGWLNLVLAALNLLPVPPLDGSRILGGFIPKLREFFAQPFVQFAGIFVFFMLARVLLGGAAGEAIRDFANGWVMMTASFFRGG